MSTPWSGLAPLGPDGVPCGESQSVRVLVPCVSMDARPRGSRAGPWRMVTGGGKWTVEVRHGVEAERVAARLGTGLSCVELADRLVVQVRRALEIDHRRVWPMTEWDLASHRGPSSCLRPRLGSSVAPVIRAAGIRAVMWSPFEVRPDSVDDHVVAFVSSQLRDPQADVAWPSALVDPARVLALSDCSQDEAADVLWTAGYGPDAVAAAHDHLAMEGASLPLDLYLTLAEYDHDLESLSLLKHHGPTVLSRLIATGLGCPASKWIIEIDALLTLGVLPGDLPALLSGPAPGRRIVEATRFGEWHPAEAARVLAGWRSAGHDPTWAQLRALRLAGFDPHEVPDARTVTRVAQHLGVDRTQAALTAALWAGLAVEATFEGIGSFDDAYAVFHPDSPTSPSQPTLTELGEIA